MKILDLLGLTELVDLCKQTFAKIIHTHKLEDITDYTVDSALSATSTNPVQNKTVNQALVAFSNDIDNIETSLVAHKDDIDNPHQILEKIIENSDLTNTVLSSEISGDAPELDPVVQAKFSELESDVTKLNNDLTELKNKQVTEEDIANLGFWKETDGKTYVDSEITDLEIRLGQQHLTFAEGETVEEALEWLDANGDTSKVYVLPDGFFYEYKEVIVETDGPSYTNRLPLATDADRTTVYDDNGYLEDYRLSGSSGNPASAPGTGMCASGFITGVKPGDTLRIANATGKAGTSSYVITYDSSNTKVSNQGIAQNATTGEYSTPLSEISTYGYQTLEDGVVVFKLDSALFGTGWDAIRVSGVFTDETIVTINEEIKEGGGTAIVKKWDSSGQAFVPTNYDSQIAKITNSIDAHAKAISDLTSKIGSDSESDVENNLINVLVTSTDVDRTTIYGEDYNGDGVNDGYKTNGTRLSSSGSVSTANVLECGASGFIPVSVGDTVAIKDFYAPQGVSTYVISYDSANTKLSHQTFWASTNEAISGMTGATWYSVLDDVLSFTVTEELFGSNVNAIRFSGVITENTIVLVNQEFPKKETDGEISEEEKLAFIREWDAPIYDAHIPVFQLSEEKPSMTNATNTPDNIYAMYDALMAKHPKYITKTDLGVCSDGINHIYRYDFREPEPYHQSNMPWSETKIKAILASGIHYEWAGIYGLYYALEEIAENPNLYDLRRNTHFIVVPVINPYCTITANYNNSIGVLNANGVQIHRNFEVGFIYPGEKNYVEFGERNHGGTEPLSEIETKCLDNIFKENTDSAFFLTCHNYDSPSDTNGLGFIWASSATKYMCNMGYRLVDKMSKAWLDKWGNELEAGIADYRTENVSDYFIRLGHAHMSLTDGTETRQATKYGIQGNNVEVCGRFYQHGTKDNVEPSMSAFTMSRSAETYINFLLTACGTYDYKDKALYT